MHRHVSKLVGNRFGAALATLGLLGLLAAGFAQEEGKRLPAPSKEDQAKAQELVQSLFKEDLAKAKDDKEAAKTLAATFLKEGEGTKDDPAARFVLYRQAAELAARSGDMDTALQALDNLSKDFVVNAAPLKADVLASAAQQANGKEDNQALAETALQFIKEAVDADDLESAGRLAKVAEEAATKAKSIVLLSNVKKRTEEVKLLQKEQERVKPFLAKLKDKQDDAEANGEVGKYYCLLRGLWGKGLPLLAKGPDGELKTLAGKDLANPKATKAQVALGDSWWDLGEKEKPPVQWRLQERAAHWYEQALPDLTGLAKVKLEKRLEAVKAHSPGAAETEPVIKVPVGEIRKFTHGGIVYKAAVSKDGKRMVSAGSDNSIKVWDVNTGKQLRQLFGHTSNIFGLAISPDGKRAVSGSADQTCRMWDLDNGKELFQVPGHVNFIYAVAIAPDGKTAVSAGGDGAIRQWDTKTGKEIRRFQGHTSYLYSLEFSKDGKKLLSGGIDGTMRLWDVAKGNELRRFDLMPGGGVKRGMTVAALSGDGKVALSSSYAINKGGPMMSEVRVWDTQSGKMLKELPGLNTMVYGVGLSPNGRRALTSSRDGIVRLWDVKSGKELQKFNAPVSTLCTASFLANGRMAISTHSDGTIRLWGLPK
jgi:hypothetical protein